MITDEEAIKMVQKLYDYCNHRHEINPKGYSERKEAWSCRGCPFSHRHAPIDGCVSWNCDIASPWVWPVYPDKDSTKIKNHGEMKIMEVDNRKSKEILLEQLQRLYSMRSAIGLLEILANEICPPDAGSHLCEDICYKNIHCVDCWREWHKSKLNEVRQNDK